MNKRILNWFCRHSQKFVWCGVAVATLCAIITSHIAREAESIIARQYFVLHGMEGVYILPEPVAQMWIVAYSSYAVAAALFMISLPVGGWHDILSMPKLLEQRAE